MKTTWWAGCCLSLAAALCHGADLGVVTILDGSARVLRGVNWNKLSEGARLQEGDVIDAADRAQVQIEMTVGPIVDVVGSAELLAVSAGPGQGKQPAPAEMYLTRGWLKMAVKPGAVVLKVRSPAGSIASSDAVAVMHVQPEALETFVERGTVKLNEPGKGAGEGAAHDLKSGDFAIRASDRPFATAGAPPQSFVAAMPRPFRDPLPSRAALFEVSRVTLVPERAITYPEAEPWLNGPYRRAFLRRFQARLADPEFRAAAMAKVQAYPEWHSMLAPQDNAPTGKAELPPAKPAEKADSGWSWPFGNTKK